MENQLTRPNSCNGIKRQSYFTCGKKLYYLYDIIADGSHVLVEDCSTNDKRWVETDKFKRMKKTKVTLVEMRELNTEGGVTV